MKFDIPDEFKQIINLQVSQTITSISSYTEISESEFKIFGKYLNNPKRILELGCGLGRMSIYLNHKLNDHNAFFILADSTVEENKPRYGWNHGQDFYNDLNLTSKFCRHHGMDNFETFDILNNDLSSLKDIDLVMSFLAVGFHNKIEDVITTLMKIANSNCMMIFGVRRGRYTPNDFKEYFKNVIIIENTDLISGKRTKEDILIMTEKKI